MLKYTILLINSISLLIFNVFFGDDVSITPKLPSTAKPGSEFVAEFVIKKGSVGGFAKLQIDIPQGLTVKELDSKGANFSTAPGSAKYIWTALPSESEFSIKMTVAVDPNARGAKPIGGRFSYIVNNAKQQVDFGPVEVVMEDNGSISAVNEGSVTPTATSTPTVAATNTQTPESFSIPKDPNAAVSTTRTISALNEKAFEVDIVIRKENIKGFAKYVDKIPEGFVASAMETSGSSFSFSDQNAKFVWVSLPATEDLKVSYKLEMQTKPTSKPMISGEFSYLENDQTQKIKANTDEVMLAPDENGSPVVANTETPVTTNTETPVSTNTVSTEPVKTIETPTVATTPTVAETPVTTNTVSTEPVKTNTEPATTFNNRSANGNVSFNVQIGAFKSSMSSDKLASLYNISDKIHTDMHEGFTKFLVGDFGDYKAARDKRENVKSKGVSGAFVTAYNSGKRITVQEALMIANQKWFR
jgi:hypothetical protein